MNKKKSIALLVVISVVLVVLAVLTFAQFRLPWNDTRIYRSFLGAIELDSDLEEGVAYELTLKEDISVEDTDIEPDEVVLTLERRLEALGYSGAQVTAYRADETENWSFRVEMRSSGTAANDIAVAARYGELEFTDGNGTYLFGSEMVAGARYISQTVQATTSYYVELRFTDEGIAALREAIAAGSTDSEGNATDFTLTITLGDSQLFSAPLTEEALLQNSLLISGENGGSLTETTAQQLALQLNSGGLAYEYEVSDPMTVSPALGENAAALVFWACLAAFIVIVILAVSVYGGAGLISSVSAFLFVMLEIVMLIVVPGITLNMAGVVGILAALVLTADSMAIIMHRMREEFKNGKTVKAAVKAAYRRSMLTITEIDAVLAVFSLVMFFLCGGYANCFAITFGIGVVISALVTMFFSQLLTYMALPLFKDKSEKFLKLRRAE